MNCNIVLLSPRRSSEWSSFLRSILTLNIVLQSLSSSFVLSSLQVFHPKFRAHLSSPLAFSKPRTAYSPRCDCYDTPSASFRWLWIARFRKNAFQTKCGVYKINFKFQMFLSAEAFNYRLHGRDVLELLVIGNLAAKVGELFMSWKICSQEKKSNIPIALCFVGL